MKSQNLERSAQTSNRLKKYAEPTDARGRSGERKKNRKGPGGEDRAVRDNYPLSMLQKPS